MQQVDMEILNELVKKMSNLCFNKCISRPGDTLGNSEKVPVCTRVLDPPVLTTCLP
jgi:hypothetical protein